MLENRRAGSSFTFDHKTEFNETDINIEIENGASSMAEFKKNALITAAENDSEDSDAKTENIEDENREEEATIAALQNLYVSEEAGNIDNTLI